MPRGDLRAERSKHATVHLGVAHDAFRHLGAASGRAKTRTRASQSGAASADRPAQHARRRDERHVARDELRCERQLGEVTGVDALEHRARASSRRRGWDWPSLDVEAWSLCATLVQGRQSVNPPVDAPTSGRSFLGVDAERRARARLPPPRTRSAEAAPRSASVVRHLLSRLVAQDQAPSRAPSPAPGSPRARAPRAGRRAASPAMASHRRPDYRVASLPSVGVVRSTARRRFNGVPRPQPLEVADSDRILPLAAAAASSRSSRCSSASERGHVSSIAWSTTVRGTAPPPTAAKIVRNNASLLRKELGDRLVTRPPGYCCASSQVSSTASA